MAEKDYYQILGVEKDASASDIKRAFRKKARELHPDVNKAPEAEAQFKELNEAYEVLSDETKRRYYDTYGTANPQAGYGYASDISDIFGGMDMADILRSMFGGAAGASAGMQAQGRDMRIGLRITLEEAALGAKKEVKYHRLAPCEHCGGKGSTEPEGKKTCPTCQGTGQVVSVQRTFLGDMQTRSTCPQCQGSGEIIEKPCPECEGQGRIPDTEHVSVEVPAGIHDHQQLKVRDFGEAGYRGAASGDLYVQVEIEEHDRFVRDGNDLHCRLPISVIQAVLGAELEIPGILPDETVILKVPAGTQHADLISVPDKGMPIFKHNPARGKLCAHVDLIVPTKLSEEERGLFEQLAKSMGESFSQLQTHEEKSTWEKIKDAISGE